MYPVKTILNEEFYLFNGLPVLKLILVCQYHRYFYNTVYIMGKIGMIKIFPCLDKFISFNYVNKINRLSCFLFNYFCVVGDTTMYLF